MIPAARVQAAIELLDQVIEAAKREGAPADRLIAAYFKQRRYAGSKDRRAVRDLVYAVIRAIGPVPANGRAAMIAYGSQAANGHILDCFDGSPHGPARLETGAVIAEPGIAPAWLVAELRASGLDNDGIAAMLGRAPLDVRVNTLKTSREALVLPEVGEPLAAPNALRFDTGTSVEQWPAYAEGQIEVQDQGSQLACHAADARPGETVIDLCAGAGGKTLSLAAQMQNQGRLIACDTDRGRLSKLGPRAERAGAGMIETVLLNPNAELDMLAEHHASADLVLVDAPCSGTGTWRRKPEAKWRLTPESLRASSGLQDRLLDIAVRLVKPGGRIVFITCSLLDAEGADRVTAFGERWPAFTAVTPDLPLGMPRGKGIRLDPFQHGTDGFFIAMLRSA